MELKSIDQNIEEPVSLTEMKNYLRVSHSADDQEIQSLITAAREHIEQVMSRRSIATQTFELHLEILQNEVKIPMPPLQSVTSVSIKRRDGTETIINPDDYIVDAISEKGRVIFLKSILTTDLFPIYPMKITFIAGYTNPPDAFVKAIKLIAGELYENKLLTVDHAVNEVLFTAESLVAPYRTGWF